MKYRREIDGLRALAVLPVIFFHAGIKVFSGGFVGVDVFFVISGYLITSIILAELEVGSFSVINFYERRARRILPALFFVLLVCLPFAWFLLLPEEMENFAKSVFAVPVFASNVLFWRTSGYFDSVAELKPLLHTWSLAVEEQYYVIFPLLLMIAWKAGQKVIHMGLLVLFAASLVLAQVTVVAQPDTAFYMFPTRAWELLIGAAVAFQLSSTRDAKIPYAVNEAMSAMGLGFVLFSVFFFSKSTPSPSLYTLVPTIGAALIIVASAQPTFAGRVLGSKPLVGVGLISYSTYLWHQPLLVFARHAFPEGPSPVLLFSLACTSLIFAYFTWKYVEAPFRRNAIFDRRWIFNFAVFGSVFFCAFGGVGYLTNGFEFRIEKDRRDYLAYFENSIPELRYVERTGLLPANRAQCDFYNLAQYRNGHSTKVPLSSIATECYVRSPSIPHSVMLWGDSHAQHLYAGLKPSLGADWQILQVASAGCQARLHAQVSQNDYCAHSNWFAYKTIVESKPDVVIVGQNDEQNISNMDALGAALLSAGVKKVIFVGPTPHWKPSLPAVVFKTWADHPIRTRIGLDPKVIDLDAKLKREFVQKRAVQYISIIDNFCDPTGCIVYLGNDSRDGITSFDYGHLTPIASRYLATSVLARAVMTPPL